ncbi:unnamed protein product [Acanthosepion pharaonis]|uniref:Reverse transcriptase domain-containing protein n=1 Tax=Acanthosepion pharaonis TaxID=158019 RepID=A0A812E6Z0_ACAPH|nr:unnamed protein product [Sepia pharaonis]
MTVSLGTKSIISSSSHSGPRVSWTVAHSGQPKQAMSMAPTIYWQTGAEIQLRFLNRFDGLQALQPIEYSAEDSWQLFKSSVNEVASQTLGKTRRRAKDWISGRTIELANQTKRARCFENDDFRRFRRETARSAKADLNTYWRNVTAVMEQAASVGDFRKLYQTSRLSEVLLDTNGTPISQMADRTIRWKQDFKTLLNHDPPFQHTTSTLTNAPEYDANCDSPTEEEICDVIKRLKNNKDAGEDSLPAELYKSCPNLMARCLHPMLDAVWRSEQLPQDRSDAILLPFYKKGDRRDCRNYRGISLIDVASKIFSIIVLRRFQNIRDRRTRPNQAGFRRGRGCIDHIFSLRRILEQRWAYHQSTVVCFIDFTAAFDSVDRRSLWDIMRHDGFPSKLLNLIKVYYAHTRTRWVRLAPPVYGRTHHRASAKDVCSLPSCSTTLLTGSWRIALVGLAGVRVGHDCSITDLDYADDVAILSESYAEVQFSRMAKMVGMNINSSKTKILSANYPLPDRVAVTLDGEAVEEIMHPSSGIKSFSLLISHVNVYSLCH